MREFSWTYLWGEPGWMILNGFYYTCILTFWSSLLALAIGLITGSLNWLRIPLLSPLIRAYVSIARNTPFVVQLLFVYFSAPLLLPIDWLRFVQDKMGMELMIAIAMLGIYHGAFFCEVVRSGLRSVHTGQLDGARALGLSLPYSLSRILFPQAVRNSLPALISEGISLAKNTSIAVAIGVTELTYQYRYLGNFDFRGVEALTMATLLYAALSLTISGLGMLLQRRLTLRSGHRLGLD